MAMPGQSRRHRQADPDAEEDAPTHQIQQMYLRHLSFYVFNGDDPEDQSLRTAISCFSEEVNSMGSTLMMLSTLRDKEAKYLSEQMEDTTSSCPRPSPTRASSKGAVLSSISVGTDLCSPHSMLNAIKEEIIAGPQPADSTAADMKDGRSTKTAAANRHHLRSCFDLLRRPQTDCPLPDQPRPE